MFERFQALLLREWMQHKRGWLITVLAPPLIFLALVPFGQVEGLPVERPLAVAVFVTLASCLGALAIALLSSGFQWPSLARRDAQDRSIEFWLSLPGTHSESLAATLLAHGVLLPLAALVGGFGFGFVLANALALKAGGIAVWSAIPWLASFSVTLPLLARGLFGVLLMAAWLAPVVLAVMVASAWLKRWGLPALGIAVGGSGLWLAKAHGNPIVFEAINRQFQGAGNAVVANAEPLNQQLHQLADGETAGLAAAALSWAWNDALLAVQNLASPQFVAGLAVAAGCFALLVLKRGRGG